MLLPVNSSLNGKLIVDESFKGLVFVDGQDWTGSPSVDEICRTTVAIFLSVRNPGGEVGAVKESQWLAYLPCLSQP